MTATKDILRENRLRRMADRHGFHLVKSRRRDPRALGGYMLVDYHGTVICGAKRVDGLLPVWKAGKRNEQYDERHNPFGATLDDVERFLSERPSPSPGEEKT